MKDVLCWPMLHKLYKIFDRARLYWIQNPSLIPHNILKYIDNGVACVAQRNHLLKHLGRVERLLNKKFNQHSKLLSGIIQKYNRNDGRRLYHLRLAVPLYIICRLVRPDLVVETGVAHGFSTIGILRALHDNGNGMLYSLDILEHWRPSGLNRDVEIGFLVPRELRDRWRLVVGPSKDRLMGLLAGLGKIDIFVHDSDHSYENMFFEFTTSWKFLRGGGYLISDDIEMNKAFDDFCQAVEAKVLSNRKLGIALKTRESYNTCL